MHLMHRYFNRIIENTLTLAPLKPHHNRSRERAIALNFTARITSEFTPVQDDHTQSLHLR